MPSSDLKHIEIYTDGACHGNPGPGGYGLILRSDSKEREISGGYRLTTNNRMEMMAAIVGLRELRYPCQVTLYTDSQYLFNGIMKGWAKSWRAKGWVKSNKERALNPDLWGELLDLCEKHDVKFVWVRGHDGHAENERCDRLSVQAAKAANLPIDEGYRRG